MSYQCDCSAGWVGDTCAEVAPAAGSDACGCSPGSGWSKSQERCKDGGRTTPDEAAACAQAGVSPAPSPGPPPLPGAGRCTDDAAGVMAAIGTECAAIVPQDARRVAFCATTLESLCPCFTDLVGAGTTVAMVCQVSCAVDSALCQTGAQPAGSSSSSCDVASLAKITSEACPRAAAGSWTPASCPSACGAAFNPWWAACGSTQVFDAQLASALGDPDAAAVFGQFAELCRGAAVPPDGGGH